MTSKASDRLTIALLIADAVVIGAILVLLWWAR